MRWKNRYAASLKSRATDIRPCRLLLTLIYTYIRIYVYQVGLHGCQYPDPGDPVQGAGRRYPPAPGCVAFSLRRAVRLRPGRGVAVAAADRVAPLGTTAQCHPGDRSARRPVGALPPGREPAELGNGRTD